jgi:hypothetical protein
MMSKPKTLVLALLLGSLCVLPAFADHGGPGSSGFGDGALTNPRLLSHYLNLSSTQNTQLQGFLKTLNTAIQGVRTAQGPLCQTLRTDVAAAHPNPTTVGDDYLALIDNQDKVTTALTAFDTSFSAILTADQLTKYDHLKQIVGLGDGKTTDLLPECPPVSSTH